MPGNNRQTQQRQSGDMKKSDVNPLLLSTDQGRRNLFTEEDLLAEDDPQASNPPRPGTSAVRLNNPVTGRRGARDVSTEGTRQQIPIPPRRTGQAPGAYPGPMQPRSGRTTTRDVPSPGKKLEGRNVHWLLYVGVGMIAALALWVVASSVLAWGTAKYNDIMYGNPRIFQTDAVVGHGDSPQHPSHFIALNLHGQVIVIELPAGNPSKSIDYVGPDLIASGDDLIPITLSFSDVNHDGKPDMIIHIQDREVIFYNDGTKFTACGTCQ